MSLGTTNAPEKPETEEIATGASRRRLGWLVVALTAVVLVLSGWLQDDAFVTLRTIDNLLHGRGLVWNPGERVQAFTHPLWLFANAGLIAVTGRYELTCLVLAVASSLAAAWLIVFRAAPSVVVGSVAVLALLFSKAWVDFATSGLEDPLTRLLLVVFVLAGSAAGSRGLFLRSTIAALATLSRPDALLVFVPSLAVALWRKRTLGRFAALAAGLLPIALWGAFALFYYGSPFPNTAHAKLGMGVPRAGLVAQGFAYLLDSVIRDPATLTMIGAGVVLALLRPRRVDAALVAGAVLYLAYVVWIGGDYMSGRFLGLPLLAAVLGVLRHPWGAIGRRALGGLGVLAVVLLVPRCLEPFVQDEIGLFRIGDERRVHHPYTGLVYAFSGGRWPDHFLRTLGEESRDGPRIRVEGAIGMSPFYGGPGVYVVDLFALSDPLRARLPGVVLGTFNRPDFKAWRAGHSRRPIPEGYLESLESGENRIADPDLARFYDVVRLVTRGPLLDPGRIRAAAELTLGVHDPLARAYVERNPELFRPRRPAVE